MQPNKENENIINCNYYNIKKIQTLNKLDNKSALTLFHVNACSLPKSIEDDEYLIDKKRLTWTSQLLVNIKNDEEMGLH